MKPKRETTSRRGTYTINDYVLGKQQMWYVYICINNSSQLDLRSRIIRASYFDTLPINSPVSMLIAMDPDDQIHKKAFGNY